jgi:asparagine synthase (glutamine-hydrolysing)
MCGIVGVVRWSGGLCADDALTMARTLRHRGPDEEGSYVSPDGSVSLGHRRLSIIDLSTGRQPLSNEDGSVWVVFNGEIYNEPDIRRELQAKGHRFKTQSDTESIVHLYEEEGVECVSRFRGMFAFAVWDVKRRRLLLARDRLGKKPLYWGRLGDKFVFGSELKALLGHFEGGPEVDWSFMDTYLALGYLPSPLTPFRGIHKLKPAHCLLLEETSEPKTWQYWAPSFHPKLRIGEEEALEELDRRLREAVYIRLRSDVPFGAFLSGGVDSSTVVALMRETLCSKVQTFTVGFEEESFNEAMYARQTALRLETAHHECMVRMTDARMLSRLVGYLDEPFADASILPTFMISQHAAQFVKMVLSGDGGDELFGGYTRYLKERLLGRLSWATAVLRPCATLLRRPAIGGGRMQRLWWIAYHAALSQGPSYETSVGIFPPEARKMILRGADSGSPWKLSDCFEQWRHLDSVERMMAVDLVSYLPEDVLVKVDRMSMASSLEVRCPFLDQEVVEFAARLPVELKIRGGSRGKYLLKRYAERFVPADWAHRRKQGFSVPKDAWFRSELADMLAALLISERDLVEEVFRPEIIRQWLKEHIRGQGNHADRLWGLLMVLLWFRVVVRGNAEIGDLLERAGACAMKGEGSSS